MHTLLILLICYLSTMKLLVVPKSIEHLDLLSLVFDPVPGVLIYIIGHVCHEMYDLAINP